MNSTVSVILKVALSLLIVFLAYKLYAIIQEPIRYQEIKTKRYNQVKLRLEQIRDAQKIHREVFDGFTADLDRLIAFVDTGRKPIVLRKDSSFTYYDETYRKDMTKDTIVKRIIGYEKVQKSFPTSFQPEDLRYIPFSNQQEFKMDAGKVTINDVTVPVFEAAAPDTLIFHDMIDDYDRYIEKDHVLKVGSLTEPTLSGNWK